MRGVGIICALGLCISYNFTNVSSENDILPEPSQEGKHTLGFNLNNEVWLPYDRGSHKEFELPQPQLGEDGSLSISATRIDEENGARNWFCIGIESNCDGPGIYEINNKSCTSPYQTYYYGGVDKSSATYEIDQNKAHYIEITKLDLKSKIVAGLFEFTAYSEQGDTLHFTEGRFDIKLD